MEEEEHRPFTKPAEFLSDLLKKANKDPKDIESLQRLAEGFFDMGAMSTAKPLIEMAIDLDPEGQFGGEKFFWLAQIKGGFDGLELYVMGINTLQREVKQHANDAEKRESLGLQISQAYLGMIEIWMTDLCMNKEAEQECERLIGEAFLASNRDPEAWSVLGSIRISQLQNEAAKKALKKSWQLFLDSITEGKADHNIVQRLIRLAQSMIELRMIEEVLEITGELYNLDDCIPDVYYLNALCHQLLLNEATTPLQRSQHIIAAREATKLLTEIQDPTGEPVPQELLEATLTIANSLPEPEIENPFVEEDTVIEMPIEEAEAIAAMFARPAPAGAPAPPINVAGLAVGSESDTAMEAEADMSANGESSTAEETATA